MTSSHIQKAACGSVVRSPDMLHTVVVPGNGNDFIGEAGAGKSVGAPSAPVASLALAIQGPSLQDFKRLQGQFRLESADLSLKSGEAGRSTFAQATFNCTSLLFGLGVLSAPYAIAQTGWLGAAICLVVAGAYGYAAQMLISCQESTGCGTYQELAKVAVGPKIRLFIATLFYVEIVGGLMGYCISVADNLEPIFPDFTFSLPGLSPRNVLLLVACMCVLPTVWLRDLSGLSFTSLWSIASSLVLVIAVLLSATVTEHIGFHHAIPIAGIRGAPIAVGLYGFAFSGTTVFPSIYKSMREPSRFSQVSMLSFAVSTIFVFGLGIVGASMFGNETKSQVTLNMPAHRLTTKIVLWTTVITPLLKFALCLSPLSQAMDEVLQERFKKYSPRVQLGITTISRSGVLAIIVIVAMLFPYFNYVIALIGSSITIAICLTFPCIFYIKINRHQLSHISFSLIIVTIVLSIVVAVCGTIVSFRGLVESKRNSSSN